MCCTISAPSPRWAPDSQGMGRIGETIARTWHLAPTCGPLAARCPRTRAAARTTPASFATSPSSPSTRRNCSDRPRGRLTGTGQAGRYRAVGTQVLRNPAEVVFMGGFPGVVGDGGGAASPMTCATVEVPAAGRLRRPPPTSRSDCRRADRRRAGGRARGSTPPEECRGARALTKADLLHNDYLPDITIEPDTCRILHRRAVVPQYAHDHRVPLGRRYPLE